MNMLGLKLTNWRGVLVFLAVVTFGWLALAHAPRVLADTNVPIGKQFPLPNSADVYNYNEATGATTFIRTGAPSIIVGAGQFDGNYAWVKVYVPIGGQANVTVQNGGGFCNGSPGVSGPNDSSDDYAATSDVATANVNYTLEDLDANETEISSTGGNYFEATNSQINGVRSCYNLTFPTIPANAGTASQLAGHQSFRVFLLIAHQTAAPSSSGNDPWKNFRVLTDNGLVGTSRPVSPLTAQGAPFGIDYQNLYFTTPENDPADNTPVFTYSYMFSTRCSEAPGSDSMYAYDMDNHVYDYPSFEQNGTNTPWNFGQDLSADIYQEDKSDPTGFNLQKHFNAGNPGQETPGEFYNSDGSLSPAKGPFTQDILGGYDEEHALGTLNYNVSPQFRYKFYINGAGFWNALQFYTGFDQFDASQFVDCFDTTCTITTDPGSGTQVTGQPVQVTVKMNNAGVAPWPGSYALGQQNPAGPSYPVSPAPVLPGGTATFSFNVTRGSPGTYALTYQMKTDTGLWFGKKCTATLTFSDFSATCTGVSPSDLEPGQAGQVKAGLAFTNGTKNSYPLNPPNSNNGYNLHVTWTPGVSVDPRSLSSSPGAIQPGLNTLIATMDLTASYQGTLSLDLYRDGAPAGLPGLPCVYTITPSTRSYFKVYGGDIVAGGAFKQANGNCRVQGRDAQGTILSYAYPTAINGGPRGSSADFGAYALGLIQGSTNGPFGFYDSAVNGGNYNRLSFANQGIADALNGGVMTGQPASAGIDHCVPDYFDTAAMTGSPTYNTVDTVNLASLTTNGNDGANANAPGQYYYQPQNGRYLTLSGASNFGQRVTIFVKGSVYINGNISYSENWDPSDLSNAPYLTVIAEGNIIVDPGVGRLDGFYVAQPLADGSHGIFATCGSASDHSLPADASQIAQNCMKQLTINGAVTAEQIKLYRSAGTLWNSAPGESLASNQAAESFNFLPSMLLGQPNFQSQQGSGAIVPGGLQGLTRLPPIF